MPAHTNNRALNSAWVIRWKSARWGRPRAIAIIITPSWLKVDKAMIFLRSHSTIAASPAINMVKVADNIKKRWKNLRLDRKG